jgi:hypothetical protein
MGYFINLKQQELIRTTKRKSEKETEKAFRIHVEFRRKQSCKKKKKQGNEQQVSDSRIDST